jgi:NADH dehydrogenase [ubiquinone] 1 alpha subcomplex assembly factor 5
MLLRTLWRREAEFRTGNKATYTRTSPVRLLEGRFFNRHHVAQHRLRAKSGAALGYDLQKTYAEQLFERRKCVKRESAVVLEVGAYTGEFLRKCLKEKELFGARQWIQTDMDEDRLNRTYKELKPLLPKGLEFVQIVCDEEQESAFDLPDHSVDMAVSNLSMHWVNELETAMVNIRTALKRDGFLLMSMYGGNTLYELRSAFTLAELEAEGGCSPHVSPMIDGAAVSQLFLQSGFALPTIDMDRLVLSFRTPWHLMEYLGDSGDAAAHVVRRGSVPRSTLLSMAACYERLYRKNQMVPATFEVFNAIGWAPSPDQPEPLPRGSGTLGLASVAGDKHKSLMEAMQDCARNPNDKEAQKLAERLFKEMQDDLKADQQKLGLGGDGMNVPPSPGAAGEERPLPPGESDK